MQTTIKILYISYDGMTDPLGQSQVLPYLTALSELGFSFHLMSFEKVERFSKGKSEIEEICKNANIVWHPQIYTKKPPVISTWKDLRTMNKLAFALHSQNNFAFIHCRSYISALSGLRCKAKLNIPFIFDMRGFWADERVDGNIWSLKNPIYNSIYKFFKRKEKQFLLESAAIISLTEAGKKEIIKQYSEINLEEKITVIPCSVNTKRFNREEIDDVELDKLKIRLGIKNKNVLLYVGSIGTWYLLDEMLDFYTDYRKEFKNTHFVFLTNEDPDIILEKAKGQQLYLDEFLIKSVKYSEIPLHIKLATHSVFFIKPAYSKIASSPVKQGELMSMGIPVISNAGVGDTAEIIKKYSSGVLVNAFSKESYKAAIDELKTKEFDKNKIRQGAIDYFSLEKAVLEYCKVYRSL